MRKIFTVLACAVMAMSAMATTFTFTSEGDVSQSKDGISVVLSKASGNNEPFFSNAGEMRLYANNTITVKGAELKNISITFSKQGSKEYASLSASSGNLVSGGVSTSNTDLKTDSWTGSGSSVTFTLGPSGQRIITQLVVNGDGSESPSVPGGGEPSTPDVPSDLNPDFEYPEPTVIMSPAISVQGAPYSFILSNVKVEATMGAVNDKYFSAHAGYNMTFTATKPIKGIVIDGLVKKGFEATVNHGTVSYLSPDADTDADPVVVIKDVNSTSVTISCVKQLRCYTVELYFEENPDATVSGGSSGPGASTGSMDLTFDSAEAVYESEYSEMMEEENYSIFLFNASSPEIPYFSLDIYPAAKDVLEGTYYWDDWTLGDYTYYAFGYGDYDITWAEGGEVTVTKSGDIYTIKGSILCDDGKTYNVSFTGEMPIYTDDEYYGDETGVEKVEEVENMEGTDASYDLLGRRVGKSYRGITIRNGKKVIVR